MMRGKGATKMRVKFCEVLSTSSMISLQAKTKCGAAPHSKACRIWLHLPGADGIQNRYVVRRSIRSVRLQRLMLPLDQTVRFRDVEFFFVLAVLQLAIAAVLITDHQRLQIRGQVAAKSFGVGTPDGVHNAAEFLRSERIAIRMRLVG